MASHIVCPKCDLTLYELTGDTTPSLCPRCGSQLCCEACGATVEWRDNKALPTRCSDCQAELTVPDSQAGPAPPPGNPSFQLPGFEIAGILGRGGMGIVYRALQLNPRRHVAIKVLHPALAEDAALLKRFRKESELAAGLVDAHILPVYAVHEVHGVPVIVMPLIEG